MKSFKDTEIGREFLAGKCYLRVTKEEWAEFAKGCIKAGMSWKESGPIQPVNYRGYLGGEGDYFAHGDGKYLDGFTINKLTDKPIHPFSALCAEPEKPQYVRGALYTINDANGCKFSVGDVVRIDQEVHDNWPYCVRLSDGFRSPAALHRLTPYTEPEKPAPTAPYDGRGKHNVGDRFVVVPSGHEHPHMRVGDIVELVLDDKSEFPWFRTVGEQCKWPVYWKSLKPIPAVSLRKIIITTDGKTTTARLMEGKQTIRTATATCSPSDTFDFGKGARLAFDRLIDDGKCRDLHVRVNVDTSAAKAAIQSVIDAPNDLPNQVKAVRP